MSLQVGKKVLFKRIFQEEEKQEKTEWGTEESAPT